LVYKIRYKKSVSKDLKAIAKKARSQILDKLEEELSITPYQYPVLKGAFAGLRKFRIGNYRVIFTIINNEVWILRIGHRSRVYK
jgi:mRNA interferase RelE/StbE